jgi:hypothetical protein
MATTLKGIERYTDKPRIRSAGGVAVLDETYTYLVVSNNIADTHLNVLQNTAGVPQVGITISPSGVGLCKSTSATRDPKNQLLWRVTAEFSSEVDERQSSYDPTTSPTAWIPVYETKFERLQEVVTVDQSGAPIANSAGQPFPTGMTVTRMIPIWEFFQFEAATVTDEQVLARNEVVNNATFKGRAAKTLLCTINSSVIGFYYGIRLRLTQYSLRYNVKNWTHKRLDVGEAYLDGTTLKPYLVQNKLIMGPLDGSGDKVPDGDPPAILEFDQYASVDFASFLRI